VLARLGEDRALYGRQRLWGAVGWGITAPVAGWLVGRLGIGAAFASYLFFLSLTFLSGLFLPVKKSGRSQPFLSGMRSLLANRGWFLFLLVAFLGGAGSSVTSNYLFLYLEDLKASSTLMGLSLTIATISELPVLFFSNQLLRRWGPRGLMILSLAAYVVRALGYSLAANPGQAVMFQLLHGLTFSAMWVAGVSYANEIAPEGLGATAQGLFSSTVMGLGGITGAFFGGLLLDRYGSAGVFRISAIVVLAGLLVFLYTGRKEISPQRTQGTQRENTK
jgi:PPP family 3-phenylpropionic acid transporter